MKHTGLKSFDTIFMKLPPLGDWRAELFNMMYNGNIPGFWQFKSMLFNELSVLLRSNVSKTFFFSKINKRYES